MAFLQINLESSLILGPDGLALLDAPDVLLLSDSPELIRIQLANGFIETFSGTGLDHIGGTVQTYRIDVHVNPDAAPYLEITNFGLSFADIAAANDAVQAALWGDDSILGGNLMDTIHGFDGHDLVYGGAGNDAINGQSGADSLFGNQGQDFLFGDVGDDLLAGGRDGDILYGNQGDDFIYGNYDDDYLFGGAGADILFGGNGNDLVYGGAGNDWLIGGIGDDWLIGGSGVDTLIGGAGRDIYDLSDLGYGDFGLDLLYSVSIEDQLLIPENVTITATGDNVAISNGGHYVTLVGVDTATVQAIATLTSSAT